MMQVSPITGIIEEDQVFLDFGKYEGKSILELADTLPKYYQFLVEEKNKGNCLIRRGKDKIFKLYFELSNKDRTY